LVPKPDCLGQSGPVFDAIGLETATTGGDEYTVATTPSDEAQGSDGAIPAPVVRDGTFARLVVDNALASFLGRDVEVSILAMGHEITKMGIVDGNADVETRAVISELARLRMAPATALTLSLNLIAVLLGAKLVNADELLDRVRNLADQSVKLNAGANEA
jgi:hypothetical protein